MHKRSIVRFAVMIALAAAFAIVPASIFAQNGGVKGKIRDQRGQGIPNATIAARQDSREIRSVRSNSKGDFVLTGLSPGTYNIAFDANGYTTGVKFGVRVQNRTVDLGNRLILAVDEGSLVLVRGSVFNSEGRSLSGAKVELFDLSSGSPRRIGTVHTNEAGDFGFRQREGASKYKVVASHKGSVGEKELEIGSAAIYRTAITLKTAQ